MERVIAHVPVMKVEEQSWVGDRMTFRASALGQIAVGQIDVGENDRERKLLERLADEGKPTRLTSTELATAQSLEADGLLFMIRKTLEAIIMPKGRHVLAGIEIGARSDKKKPPFGFTS